MCPCSCRSLNKALGNGGKAEELTYLLARHLGEVQAFQLGLAVWLQGFAQHGAYSVWRWLDMSSVGSDVFVHDEVEDACIIV